MPVRTVHVLAKACKTELWGEAHTSPASVHKRGQSEGTFCSLPPDTSLLASRAGLHNPRAFRALDPLALRIRGGQNYSRPMAIGSSTVAASAGQVGLIGHAWKSHRCARQPTSVVRLLPPCLVGTPVSWAAHRCEAAALGRAW
eukprot:3364563-Pyramimonas_sp.AAC.2